MATAALSRAFPSDLELRGDGRTVVGIAVPFDQPTKIRDLSGSYTETFKRGSFAKTIAGGKPQAVKFFALHETQKLPLGRALNLREDAAGLAVELRVSKTKAGDEALELIRDRALDGLSVGFQPVQDRWNTDRSTVDRLEVRLREISAVSFPAYAGAAIAGVRSFDGRYLAADVALKRLELLQHQGTQ